MQSDAVSPVDYRASLDPDWRREKLEELRSTILAASPGLEESIHHKMLGYGTGDSYIFHLNVQKNYVSLYVDDASQIDPDGALLDGLDVGKGCVRFKARTSIPTARIEEFVRKAIDLWERDTGSC